MPELKHDQELRKIKTSVKKDLIKEIKGILSSYDVVVKYVTGYQEDFDGTSYSICVEADPKDLEKIDIETSTLYQWYPKSVGPFSGKWLIDPNGTGEGVAYSVIIDKLSRPWEWNPDGSSINTYAELKVVNNLEALLVKSRTNPKLFKSIEKSIRALAKV